MEEKHAAGEALQLRVLDVNKKDGILDLTEKPSLLEGAPPQPSKKKKKTTGKKQPPAPKERIASSSLLLVYVSDVMGSRVAV